MLQIKNLKKSYKLGKEEVPVLKNINFEIEQGSFVALLGPSGCGKSTLLNILGGLDTFEEGKVIVAKEDISQYQANKEEGKLESYRLHNIGTIFQSFNLISHMNALENVEVPMKLAGFSKEERNAKAKELLSLVGLEDRIKYKPNQLSGGQKQRVAIARALALDPKIILADEPTGALDTKTGQQILDLLKDISAKNGTTIVMVTHAPEIAKESNHIIRMLDGEIVSDEQNEVTKINKKPKDKKFKKMGMKSAIKHAYKNILQKKWRNLLISLGGSIGIAGIALIVGLGMGIEDEVKSIVGEFLDENAIMVYEDKEKTQSISTENLDKIRDIEGVKEVVNTYSFLITNNNEQEQFFGHNISTITEKQTEGQIFSQMLTKGEFPDNDSEIVLDENMAKSLLDEGQTLDDLLNQDIELELKGAEMNNEENSSDLFTFTDTTYTDTYTVAGFVMSGESYILNSASDKIVKELYPNSSPTPLSSSVIVEDVEYIDSVSKSLENMGLYTQTNEQIMDSISKYSLMIQVALGMFAGVSLIVSSIMIGIVLYISVIERVREIGILRAIGARRKDIRRIFLTEAGIIGFLSAVIGLIFAGVGVLIGNLLIIQLMGDSAFNAFTLPLPLIAFCLIFSISLSLLAGLFPAYKASRLNPVDALRHE